MNRLSKTGIEYGDYGWTIYRGCQHKQTVCAVKSCWAEAMAKRQGWDFHKPELLPENLLLPLSIRQPSYILVNFMGDLFGDWVEPNNHIGKDIIHPSEFQRVLEFDYSKLTLKNIVFQITKLCDWNTFIFLTKAPWNLKKWGKFPDNCWVGASTTDSYNTALALRFLKQVDAKNKWLSIEPLLNDVLLTSADLELGGISWVVIGAQTRPQINPKIEWVKEIVQACDKAGVKVWLKENLYELLRSKALCDDIFWSSPTYLRQELT